MPDYDRRSAKVRRRLVTIPRHVLGLIVVTITLPLLLVAALIFDLVRWASTRRRFMASRLVLFLWVYLFLGVLGVIAFGFGWLLSGFGLRRDALVASAYPVQTRWATALFNAGKVLFRLSFEVTGDDAAKPGPIIMLMNHASLLDVVLPITVVAGPHRMRLRYLLKRELLTDPAIDIGGLRLPNYFVDRRAATLGESSAIRQLATGIGERDGVLIYPEGTRFTPAKLERALKRLAKSDPEHLEAARKLRHVLPPRPAGTLAALDGSPDADVVFAAHVGLTGLAEISDFWSGAIIGREVKMSLWRVPRSSIPEDRKGRLDWLIEQWQRVDDWVDEAL
ncbi:MAG: lysophospholipid acyltransferase family protein [Acidimicrobiia bacterium]|nr:lysophospholipid acyltransferase family protein [Acidimicrobiia bacterium]